MTRLIVRHASVATLTERGDLADADILIDGDTIVAVGPQLEAGDAQQFDATGMVVIPGMANTHTHLIMPIYRGLHSGAYGHGEFWINLGKLLSTSSLEDAYVAVYSGAVELLNAGVTSIFQYTTVPSSAEFADVVLQAVRDSGIRAVYGYDMLDGHGSVQTPDEHFTEVERLTAAAHGDPLVEIGVCLRKIVPDSIDQVAREIELSRAIGARMSFHNNAPGEIVMLARAGLLGPDILAAHSNVTTGDDLDALADVGGYLSANPELEINMSDREYTMVARAHRRGAHVSLGDNVPSVTSPGITTQMRLLYMIQRYLDGEEERQQGRVPITRRPESPRLSHHDLLTFGTYNGVAAMGWGDRLGRIAAGYLADLVFIDARTFGVAEGGPAVHAVHYAPSPADINSVMVAGEFRKRGGVLVGVDPEQLGPARKAAKKRMLAAAGLPAEGYRRPDIWWDWVPESLRTS